MATAVDNILFGLVEQKTDWSAEEFGESKQYYIKEFGQLTDLEARALGIPERDFAWQGWTSFDQGENLGMYFYTINDKEGNIIGFREVEEKHELKPITMPDGSLRFLKPHVTPAAPFVVEIKDKYRPAQAKRILAKLLEMHKAYMAHLGNGYSVSRRFWNRQTDKEMTEDEKMQILAGELGVSKDKA